MVHRNAIFTREEAKQAFHPETSLLSTPLTSLPLPKLFLFIY